MAYIAALFQGSAPRSGMRWFAKMVRGAIIETKIKVFNPRGTAYTDFYSDKAYPSGSGPPDLGIAGRAPAEDPTSAGSAFRLPRDGWSMISGTVFDIKKFALHDGPGLRTTVFLKGCPLCCPWCHNPEGILPAPQRIARPERCIGCGLCAAACPEQALELDGREVVYHPGRCVGCGACAAACPAEAVAFAGKVMSVGQVLAEIEQDRSFYDQSGGGVTFSGGEPLMQPDFLLELLKACGSQDLHRTVDTTGYGPVELLRAVAESSELLLFDLKHMDSRRHQSLTGVPNEPILDNLTMLAKTDRTLWVRIPLIPGVNDNADNLTATARFLGGLPHPPRVQILPYHSSARGKYQRLTQPYALAQALPPTRQQLAAAARLLGSWGLPITIEGDNHDPSCRATA